MRTFKPEAKGRVGNFARLTVPFLMLGLCLWALEARVGLPSPDNILPQIQSLGGQQWAVALFATAISFWALGRYDQVAHRHLATGLGGKKVRVAGMAAIGFSQTVGFGLFTGSYARWKLLPELSAIQATQITALVGLTFMAALSGIVGLALTVFAPTAGLANLGLVLCLIVLLGSVISFFYPALRIGRLQLRWPSILAMAALSFWAFIDVIAAGTALWILLPSTLVIDWPTLVTVYAIALGFAIMSSAPGGAGPFELAFVTLLPGQESVGILSALLAFRLVYYALPAAISCFLILAARHPSQRTGHVEKELGDLGSQQRPASTLPENRTCSETGIIRQNGGHLQVFGLNQLAMLTSPQAAIVFFDPVSGFASETLAPLSSYARSRNLAACFYKCGSTTAISARRSGWVALRIASDAVVNPNTFSEAGSRHRQLRRKLRHAEKDGLSVHPAPEKLPLAQMAGIDAAWQTSHGHAYGTTMGRFESGYLAQQKVLLAWKDGYIVAFASFHTSASEWCLDLIRIAPGAPDGTGHALIRSAIELAHQADIPRLNLAAVPDHRFSEKVDKGLRRFKECFAPSWEPRYLVAPNWLQMLLCIAELIRLVHRPDPVSVTCPTQHDMDLASDDLEGILDAAYLAHNELEEKEIALRGAS